MAFLTILGTCGSTGTSDCLRCERGEGVDVTERASRSIAVGFASPSTTLHSEVELVGDKEGSGSFELDSEVGVEGTGVLLAGDDNFGGGSWLTTVVSGCPNIPPPPPPPPPPPLQPPVGSEK